MTETYTYTAHGKLYRYNLSCFGYLGTEPQAQMCTSKHFPIKTSSIHRATLSFICCHVPSHVMNPRTNTCSFLFPPQTAWTLSLWHHPQVEAQCGTSTMLELPASALLISCQWTKLAIETKTRSVSTFVSAVKLGIFYYEVCVWSRPQVAIHGTAVFGSVFQPWWLLFGCLPCPDRNTSLWA